MSKSGFLTATGILVVALFVWGLLWMVTGQLYVENGASTWSIGYGLTWVYVGVLVSLVALVWTLFVDSITRVAIVLVGTAVTLAGLQVLAGLVGMLWKIALIGDLWSPIFSEPTGLPWGFAAFGLLIVIPIIVAIAWVACIHWIQITRSFFRDLIANQY